MKSRRPLLTGFRKPTHCPTCWRRRRAGLASNRSTSGSPSGFPLDKIPPVAAAGRNQRPMVAGAIIIIAIAASGEAHAAVSEAMAREDQHRIDQPDHWV